MKVKRRNLKKKEKKPTILDSLQRAEEPAFLMFSDVAMAKMLSLIMRCPIEVGWQGTVRKISKGHYLVDDIFIYPQATTAASIWIDDLRFGIWQNKICMEDPEFFDSIRFHGHSHVNMATFASSTDRELQESWIEMLQEDQFYIFMIANKRLESWCRIADREDGVLYDKVIIDTPSYAIGQISKDYNENVNTVIKREEIYHGHK